MRFSFSLKQALRTWKEFFIVILGFLLALGIVLTRNAIKGAKLEKADGVVVRKYGGMVEGLSNYRMSKTFYIIEYKVDGATYSLTTRDRILGHEYDVWDKVRVIYDPEDTDRAWLYTLWGYWISGPELIIILLIGFFSVGVETLIGMIIARSRRARTTVS